MTTQKDIFESAFSFARLKELFIEDVSHSKSTGVDNVKAKVFERDLDKHLAIIIRKVYAGEYHFTRYKQKLISKGANKPPRIISIPTVRDKLVLKALNTTLQEILSKHVNQRLPQLVTRDVKQCLESTRFDTVIKLDIKNYYPSIKHSELLNRLRRFIKHKPILMLVENALKTCTSAGKTTQSQTNNSGVPQGLPISNILSNIYLRNIDNWLIQNKEVFYSRYVDDVLIMCHKEDTMEIVSSYQTKCKHIGLEIYDVNDSEKSLICKTFEQFDFLGYLYNPSYRQYLCIGVRERTVRNLRQSLVGMFTSYSLSSKPSLELLKWRLNIRVTGCIADNKPKGWLFFFSEIDDQQLLHELDGFLKRLKVRFNVLFDIKRFTRTWYEIQHNRWRNRYVPNFDKFTVSDMRKVIVIYDKRFFNRVRSTDEVEIKFRSLIYKEIKDLETDIMDFS